MTYQTPCNRPENDPDDWFISRDGRQYAYDDLLNEEEKQSIIEKIKLGDEDAAVEVYDRALDRAEADAKTAALQKRRHAKEACYGCYLRMQCLDLALDRDEQHGTWGGYYEEELREIRRKIARRKRDRNNNP